MSYTPIDMPIGCQATITRETARTYNNWTKARWHLTRHDKYYDEYSRTSLSIHWQNSRNCKWKSAQSNVTFMVYTLLVSWKELTPGSLSSSGTNTFFKRISPFWTIRKPILFSILVALSPGAFFFTIYLKQRENIQHMTWLCPDNNNPYILAQTKANIQKSARFFFF